MPIPKRSADQKAPETQLNARGLSLRDDYRHEFPKWMNTLRAKREEGQFFLRLQHAHEDTEARLAEQDLPLGGAREILSEMYYPVDETPGRLDSPIMH